MSLINEAALTDPRLQWFREARFGMFIHFGLYSLLERGEWVQYWEQIPRAEYAALAKRFNPGLFDAGAWADLAVRSGCRYVALTTKHHDGFCLFDSALTEFNSTRTPFGRDLVGEMVEACRQRGLHIVLYYSQPDWHHPNFVHYPGVVKDWKGPLADQKPDWDAYLAYYHGQVEELCTQYGKIDGIWFDGVQKTEEIWQGKKIYNRIKELQPEAVVNERAGYGDFFTPENQLPEDLHGFMFEACQCITQTSWGWHKDAAHFSTAYLVNCLTRVLSEGGNFLLNVGPRPDGVIPDPQAGRMEAVGEWLRRNEQALIAAKSARLARALAQEIFTPDLEARFAGRNPKEKTALKNDAILGEELAATLRENTLSVFLNPWPPTDRVFLPAVRAGAVTARLLPGDVELEINQTPEGLYLAGLPPAPPDPVGAVIEVALENPAGLVLRQGRVEEKPKPASLNGNAQTVIPSGAAAASGLTFKGMRPRRLKLPGVPPSTRLADPAHALTWEVEADQTRRVQLAVELSCMKPYHGGRLSLVAGDSRLEAEVPPSDSLEDFQVIPFGPTSLRPGRNTIRLQPEWAPFAVMTADVAALIVKSAD